LGLLAALLAHAAVYGGGHAMGGRYGTLVAGSAALGLTAALVAALVLAWSHAGQTVNGSVLAARLSRRLPSWPTLAIASSLWFAAAECAEPHHAIWSPAVLGVTLAAAAFIVRAWARASLRFIATIVFAMRRRGARIVAGPIRRAYAAPIRRGSEPVYAQYARPPPGIPAGA
jgi:hypothetical protein